jgi:hypothetical protein
MRCLITLLFILALLAGSVPLRAESRQATTPEIEVVRHFWAETGPSGMVPCTECPGLPKAYSDNVWRSRPAKYVAWVELRNRNRQAIKSIDMDFVFNDPATGVEFLRYHVHSKRRIGSGKRVEIRHFVRDVKKESGYTPSLPDEATLRRTYGLQARLEFARIEYADGSVWSRP